jgi:hypothetical protein
VDILGIIARAIAKIIETSLHLLAALMALLEEGLRAPLDHAGIKGGWQTLIVALVPLLTLVAAVKLLSRIIRAVVVLLVLGFLLFILWPLVLDVYMMARGLK